LYLELVLENSQKM